MYTKLSRIPVKWHACNDSSSKQTGAQFTLAWGCALHGGDSCVGEGSHNRAVPAEICTCCDRAILELFLKLETCATPDTAVSNLAPGCRIGLS